MGLRDRIAALLGVSAYQPAPPNLITLDSPEVIEGRRAMGGQIQPIPFTQTRWYLADLERAMRAADVGDIGPAARLMTAALQDGVVAGVLSTLTDGLVRLPKRIRAKPEILESLRVGSEYVRSTFDEMCPASELSRLAADGALLGVGVAELVPVEGRDYPVLVRLDPQFLYYIWTENRWYYRSLEGLIAITPGDGKWVLHTPGGRMAPWQAGRWRAVGQAWIRKQHAQLYKDNWEAKLANPARVATAPQGAEGDQSEEWFRAVMAWGVNSVFRMLPGYDVKLLESNGRGWESFVKTIEEQNREIIISIAGQTVTVDGGTGFANADVHKTIRADIVQGTADALAYTMNTQVLPQYVVQMFGEDALDEGGAVIHWDVTPPKDRTVEAQSMATLAGAITTMRESLTAFDRSLDIDSIVTSYGIPVLREPPEDIEPAQEEPPKLRAINGGKS